LCSRCDEAIDTLLCINAAAADCAIVAAALFEHRLHALDERCAFLGPQNRSGDARSLLLLALLFGFGMGPSGCFGFGVGNALRFLPASALRVEFCLLPGGIDVAARTYCIGVEPCSVGLSGARVGRVRKAGLKEAAPAGGLPARVLEAAVGGSEQGEEPCGNNRSSPAAQGACSMGQPPRRRHAQNCSRRRRDRREKQCAQLGYRLRSL